MLEQLRKTPDPSAVIDAESRARVCSKIKSRMSWYSCRTEAEGPVGQSLLATTLPGQVTFFNERHGILLHKDKLHTASHGSR